MTVSISSAAGRATRPLIASVSAASATGQRAASTFQGERGEARRSFRPYGARNGDFDNYRPPRPEPNHFTTRPELVTIIETLQAALRESELKLRQQYVLPLPRGLPKVPVPKHKWLPRERLALTMRRDADYRQLTGTLGALARMRQIASLSNQHDVARRLAEVMKPFERERVVQPRKEDATGAAAGAAAGASGEAAASTQATSVREKKGKKDIGVDEFGRAYAIGRRKTSSARVWIVPTQAQRSVQTALDQLKAAQAHLASTQGRLVPNASEEERAEVQAQIDEATAAVEEASETFTQVRDSTGPPASEILVNHLPLSQFFGHIDDRDKVLRPLRLTGLLGAYNVFALVRGGGTTGQKDAVALGIARALRIIRPDTRDVLFNAGLLRRDPRHVERKKTNRPKARKRVSAAGLLMSNVKLTKTVRLGQALSLLISALNLISHALHWTALGEVKKGEVHQASVTGCSRQSYREDLKGRPTMDGHLDQQLSLAVGT